VVADKKRAICGICSAGCWVEVTKDGPYAAVVYLKINPFTVGSTGMWIFTTPWIEEMDYRFLKTIA
jgi:hypothetical protein